VRVDPEIVRRWCLAHENGDPNGLASSHFGVDLSGGAKRKNRRIHVEDWEEFKVLRRQQDRQQDRAAERVLRVEPIRYRSREERKASVRAAAARGR
jgi:hypothetical protein